ncbi:hypothetical protein L3X38_042316 [Prunus dulcis]|uniref:Uncharacterized protein n=1 Tax=Prunus dulcis TaxID=3755 RepID=A0AAD4UWL7_PRUDU|nr:hypothetical protein L3X38_042316 [Prunus dulcis]
MSPEFSEDTRSRADYISSEFCEDMHSRVDHMSPEFCEDVTYMVLGIDGIFVAKRVFWSFALNTYPMLDTQEARLGSQSGIWVKSCHVSLLCGFFVLDLLIVSLAWLP